MKNSNQKLDLVDAILDDFSLLPRGIMDKNPIKHEHPGKFIQHPTRSSLPCNVRRSLYNPYILCGLFFVREILHIRITVYYLRSFGVMQKLCLMFGRNSQSWMQVCKSMVPLGSPRCIPIYYYMLDVGPSSTTRQANALWCFRKPWKALPIFNGHLYIYII